MKINYEWLQTFFEDGTLPSPDELAEKLIFHAYEVEGIESIGGTSVLDVDVLPNRAADSLSHRGIAHEVSALLDIPMRHDPLREHVELLPQTNSVHVTLDKDASCSYYIAAHITGVKVGGSPEWLKNRLEAIGQRSINNIVDATNYVLFDIGRPTHVFDADKFAGEAPHIGTRLAREGEKMDLLGGDEVELADSITLITDANSDAPVAVGGIKGGALAEVDGNTTNVIIETANFHPKQTRLAAQKLKLRTDASARFENNMADQLAQYGVAAVVKLILEVAGGEFQGYTTDGDIEVEQPTVSVNQTRTSSLLGADIDADTMENIFSRLSLTHERDGNSFTVTAPFERRDIHIPEDVIEEVGRVYGYNKIESAQLPPPEKTPGIQKKFAYAEHIRNTLSSNGFTEVYLYSLRNDGEVPLINSLASDKDHLRSDLSSGIVESLERNEKQMPLLGLYDTVRIFEIGNVFKKDGEETHVSIGVRVSGNKKKEERTQTVLAEAKEILKALLQVSLPEPKGETLEFSLDAILADLPDVDAYPKSSVIEGDITYNASSQYPFVLRDIAVWVPEGVAQDAIQRIVEKHAGALLKRNDLFDEFAKDGRTSYAFHLVFQSMKETLTDEKVGAIMAAIETEIAQQEGWEIR